MTAHSKFFEWKVGEEIPEGFVDDIVFCVDMNLKIRSSCFAVMHHADSLVHNCANAVDQERLGETFDWKFDDEGTPESLKDLVTDIMSKLREKGLCESVEQPETD